MSRTRLVGAISLGTATILAVGTLLAVDDATTATPAHATGLSVTLAWQHNLPDGSPVLLGGAGVGDLDGQGPSVIVGDRNGYVYAFHTSDGSSVSGFPYHADAGVESTPSVSGSGSSARIYIGVGTSAAPSAGGYLKLSNTGSKMWEVKPYLLPGNRGGTRGIMSSLAVGSLQSDTDVIGGSMGQQQIAINSGTGKALPGFPWLQADTNFSTPALGIINGSSHDQIVEGGDSTKGVADYYQYQNGGHIRILKPTGDQGQRYQNGGLTCQYNTNEVVQSSPAVGNLLNGGYSLGIVVGTGTFYKGVSDANKFIAINTSCQLQWKTTLDGSTQTSPALADVDGNPATSPDVVVESGAGTLYDLNGMTGAVRWSIPFGGGSQSSPTTFQDPFGAWQDIVATTGGGTYLVNGLTHSYTQISSLRTLSAATETLDPDGRIGITITGFSGNTGIVQHYTVNGSYPPPTTINTPGSWPMFHRDPQLDGWAADLPVAPKPPLSTTPHNAPAYQQPASAKRTI